VNVFLLKHCDAALSGAASVFGHAGGSVRSKEKCTMSRKDKLAAALLAIFLGGLGIHKFYLGMKWWGLFYLLFCWTGIPAIVGFIEGIIYLFQSEEKFNQKYNSGLI
jgi:TM2 domain-containing membrane protein YozV